MFCAPACPLLLLRNPPPVPCQLARISLGRVWGNPGEPPWNAGEVRRKSALLGSSARPIRCSQELVAAIKTLVSATNLGALKKKFRLEIFVPLMSAVPLLVEHSLAKTVVRRRFLQ